ncbi:DUF3102 domain-containing protein [Trichocoleus desertorum AS-A10]|uniref:DUF3102 domain-containing protein n=1 Tax=Trichocoleus desertorum TaxID=1481672 RepID=UPI00329A0F6B
MTTTTAVEILQQFDYGSLDLEQRVVVQQRTSEIKDLINRNAQNTIEIGQKLIEIRARLGHGHWQQWLGAEFNWSQSTAESLMHVARAFDHNRKISDFAPSALYLLAAPSTPESAREKAIALAESGERVTHAKAREIVNEHKAPTAKAKPEEKFYPGREVLVTDADHPHHGKTVTVSRTEGAIALCEVEGSDEPEPFLLSEIEPEDTPPPQKSEPKPLYSSPKVGQTTQVIYGLEGELEVQKQRSRLRAEWIAKVLEIFQEAMSEDLYDEGLSLLD